MILKIFIGCRDFGKNIIEIKPIMKSLRLLMKHTSQGVRDETKQLILEMYRWTGPEFKQMLEAELPSAQVHLDFDSFVWKFFLRFSGMTTCNFTSFLQYF